MDDELRPPSRAGLLRESLGAVELGRLLFSYPFLSRLPRGDGGRVLVLPGYGAGDGSTLVLRDFLKRLGHDARGWGMGRNSGDVPELIPRVAALVEQQAQAVGEPVALVGWSLGGYLAREAARERPDAVRRIVTLGSPVRGGPKYTVLADVYRGQGEDLDAIESAVEERRREKPLRAPVTAIYSRMDGVVAWRACIDEREETVEHVEVATTHFGLGFSPEVYRIVARRLAARAGDAEEGA